ncbi:unnamed protein product, partial [Mesorhabditis spiculigera]
MDARLRVVQILQDQRAQAAQAAQQGLAALPPAPVPAAPAVLPGDQLPAQPPATPPPPPPQVDIAGETAKILDIYPKIEVNFIHRFLRSGWDARAFVDAVTDERVHPPMRRSDRIQDISLQNIDDDESDDDVDDGVQPVVTEFEKPSRETLAKIYAELEQRLQDAYANMPAAGREPLALNWHEKAFLRRLAPNILATAQTKLCEYSLNHHNALLAMFLYSRENSAGRERVEQLFINHIQAAERDRRSVFGRRRAEYAAWTKAFHRPLRVKAEANPSANNPTPGFMAPLAFLEGLLPKADMFECAVCFNEEYTSRSIECTATHEGGETHRFCFECLKGYVGAAVSEIASISSDGTGLRCMDSSCTNVLKQAEVMRKLPSGEKQMRRKLETAIARAAVAACGMTLEDCVFCSFAQEFCDPVEVNKVFDCRKCRASFCRLCKIKWSSHMGLKCEEAKESGLSKEDVLRLQLEEDLSNIFVRQCKRCNQAFQKDEGCNKMTCRCGALQCYVCDATIAGYDHFCNHPKHPNDKECPQRCGHCFLWVNIDQQRIEKGNEVLAKYRGRVPDDDLAKYASGLGVKK